MLESIPSMNLFMFFFFISSGMYSKSYCKLISWSLSGQAKVCGISVLQ